MMNEPHFGFCHSDWKFPSTGNAKTEEINQQPRGLYFGIWMLLTTPEP